MNEIKKAIKILEDKRTCDFCEYIELDHGCVECDRVSPIMAGDLHNFYNEAIQALQEKAEREKGCGHCKTYGDFQADMIVFENGDEKIEVQLCFGMLEIIHKRDDEIIYHVDTEINYCPMCGRKLVEE